ncbi:ATP synthase subunit B family protein [Mycobacteroides abscessus]|uniref:hypothetical protein n=1 Tax=Mycobacteroides abscessus TaxID=36809 RepID=UPI0009288C65|nr:hypothetical protein [Mycobacteroides abscessus]SIF35068.1 Uncharacterised protein [Mycobacteroides abscessus subsp. abscessus]
MTTNPYGEYARIIAEVADSAEALGDDMAASIGLAPDAEGLTADAVREGFEADAQAMRDIASAARELSTIAADQGPADARLAAAPTRDDVSQARQKVVDAEARGAAPEEVRAARNHASDLAIERDDALDAHASASARTAARMGAVVIPEAPAGINAPLPVVKRGGDAQGQAQRGERRGGADSSGGDLPSGPTGKSPSSSGDVPSTSGSSLSDADAGTSLSADGSGVPMTAQQLAGQPQSMQPQQGGVPGQPQMSPMGQIGAVPSTGAGNLSTGTASRGKAKDKRRNDNGTPIAPVMSPMSFGNASSGGTVDRGSSTSGVTTAANTSGNLKTALSGAVVPPGTGAQPGMMARGMGGGMMGGAPGAGGAGGGTSKERPVIYDANRPDEVERSDSIQDGTLSRSTAEDPNVVEERELQK